MRLSSFSLVARAEHCCANEVGDCRLCAASTKSNHGAHSLPVKQSCGDSACCCVRCLAALCHVWFDTRAWLLSTRPRCVLHPSIRVFSGRRIAASQVCQRSSLVRGWASQRGLVSSCAFPLFSLIPIDLPSVLARLMSHSTSFSGRKRLVSSMSELARPWCGRVGVGVLSRDEF